jgi:hypothetical protein
VSTIDAATREARGTTARTTAASRTAGKRTGGQRTSGKKTSDAAPSPAPPDAAPAAAKAGAWPDRRRLFTGFAGFGLSLTLGAVLGLAATWWIVGTQQIPGSARAGAWTAWLAAGGPSADPYARAVFARRGDVPMTPGEGLALVAGVDETGRRLDGRCSYVIEGPLPPARAWTLTAYGADGGVPDNRAGRYHLSGTEIVRQADGAVRLTVGPEPEGGNWLPTAIAGPMLLILRLYETPASASLGGLARVPLPRVSPRGCAR